MARHTSSGFSLTLFLEMLPNTTKHLTRAMLQDLADASTVCLNKYHSGPSIDFRSEGEFACKGRAYFNTPTYEMLNTWSDIQEATEYGAVGIATLLVDYLGYEIVQRAPKGTGFDYYIGPKGGPKPFLYQNTVKLEVSGILKGTARQRQHRLEEKTTQMHGTTQGSGYAIVVEFSEPVGLISK